MHMMTCQVLMLGQNTRGVTPTCAILGTIVRHGRAGARLSEREKWGRRGCSRSSMREEDAVDNHYRRVRLLKFQLVSTYFLSQNTIESSEIIQNLLHNRSAEHAVHHNIWSSNTSKITGVTHFSMCIVPHVLKEYLNVRFHLRKLSGFRPNPRSADHRVAAWPWQRSNPAHLRPHAKKHNMHWS